MISSTDVSSESKEYSLEDWMLNPPDNTEWVDGELVKKNGVTLKHSRIQPEFDVIEILKNQP